MFLIVVLAAVGGISVVGARTMHHGLSRNTLMGNSHGASSPSKRTARPALAVVSLTGVLFIPLLLIAYVAIGVIRHALGQ